VTLDKRTAEACLSGACVLCTPSSGPSALARFPREFAAAPSPKVRQRVRRTARATLDAGICCRNVLAAGPRPVREQTAGQKTSSAGRLVRHGARLLQAAAKTRCARCLWRRTTGGGRAAPGTESASLHASSATLHRRRWLQTTHSPQPTAGVWSFVRFSAGGVWAR
jgi:hypothetical protein